MSEEGAIKEGKAKGNSIFKLGTLKQIAKKRGLIIGLPKPKMIVALRGAVARAAELKVSKRLREMEHKRWIRNIFLA
jgi:hypothetical protein